MEAPARHRSDWAELARDMNDLGPEVQALSFASNAMISRQMRQQIQTLQGQSRLIVGLFVAQALLLLAFGALLALLRVAALHAVAQLCAVFRACPQVERVILYGSRAKGNYRVGSDIDLTVEGEGLSLAQLLAMESQIDELLLPWMVDLSLKDRIDNPALLDHIARVGLTFYERGRADA